eukprot:4035257-Prymnesium_polylepis.1
MEKHELRNELPPACGDKGYYSTACWVPLDDVLMTVSRETVSGKLQTFRDGLATALDKALLARPAAPPSPETAEPVAAAAGEAGA